MRTIQAWRPASLRTSMRLLPSAHNKAAAEARSNLYSRSLTALAGGPSDIEVGAQIGSEDAVPYFFSSKMSARIPELQTDGVSI